MLPECPDILLCKNTRSESIPILLHSQLADANLHSKYDFLIPDELSMTLLVILSANRLVGE